MSASTSEHFVHLQNAQQPEEPLQLLTRTVGVRVPAGQVLVGIDAGGGKHVLVPVLPSEGIVEDRAGSAVRLVERSLVADGEMQRYVDLACSSHELGYVFESLADDVLSAVQDVTDVSTAVHRVLSNWRALLRSAGRPFGREAAVGLIGELEVLRVLAERDPSSALSSWKGSSGVHDFSVGNRALEVKTTASVDGNFVTIHNLDQLDPDDWELLLLVAVHLRQSDGAPSIDDRIDHLTALGLPRDQLAPRLEGHGYVYESVIHGGHRYDVRGVRAWKVLTGGPGLRRSAIREGALAGVGKVNYELALDALGSPHQGDEASRWLQDWLGAL